MKNLVIPIAIGIRIGFGVGRWRWATVVTVQATQVKAEEWLRRNLPFSRLVGKEGT
jgi:hypothetical protein